MTLLRQTFFTPVAIATLLLFFSPYTESQGMGQQVPQQGDRHDLLGTVVRKIVPRHGPGSVVRELAGPGSVVRDILPLRDSRPFPFFHPETFPLDINLNLCHLNSGSMFCKDPGVELFIKTFALGVEKSDILRQVFDLSCATPQQYKQFVYQYNLDLYQRRCFKNAPAIAEFAARGITNFHELTRPLMVRMLHNTAANFLFVEGILKLECAESLALKYVDVIENYARANLTADPTSKFLTLADTFFNFTVTVDSNSKTLYPLTTYYFGNEWFVASEDMKCKGIRL